MRLLALLVATFVIPASAGPILYGTVRVSGGSTLVQLDPETGGLLNTIGSVGYIVNGLSYDASTDTLFGSTAIGDPNFFGLISIDPQTGAGTPIGTGWGDWSGLSMAITSVSADRLGRVFAWDENPDNLVSVDKVTGTYAATGASGIGTARYGLAFDNSGVLYLVQPSDDVLTFWAVDTATGAATLAHTIATSSYAHHGDFHPDSNMYYGISATWNPRELLVVDMESGTFSTLPTVDDLHTITFAADVPEPAALLLCGAGLLALGLTRRRRA
jgi:hypothetical protein